MKALLHYYWYVKTIVRGVKSLGRRINFSLTVKKIFFSKLTIYWPPHPICNSIHFYQKYWILVSFSINFDFFFISFQKGRIKKVFLLTASCRYSVARLDVLRREYLYSRVWRSVLSKDRHFWMRLPLFYQHDIVIQQACVYNEGTWYRYMYTFHFLQEFFRCKVLQNINIKIQFFKHLVHVILVPYGILPFGLAVELAVDY